MKKWVLQFLLFTLGSPFHLFSQEVPADTLKHYRIAKDVDLDTIIEYRAENIFTDAKARLTRLIGQAEVVYQNMRLTAGLITIDWDQNLLIAEKSPDSLLSNNGQEPDSLAIGFPTLLEGGQVMIGERMIFNFKTKKGRVLRGRTQYQEGYYTGEQIKKTSDEVYYVKSGRFSTCDLPEPHYYFASDKMKMIYKDKVIAKPIVFYIHNIPIAALPFAVFPNRQGRHSGLLVPRFGQSSYAGRYLRGLGYYWAASEYWDTKVELDFYEKSGFMIRNTTNYAVRYLLRGSVSGSWLRQTFNGTRSNRWDVTFNHSQTISPTMTISGSGAFVSDGNYYTDLSGNRDQRLRREMRSNLTLTKSWPESKNSLTVNVSRSQYLDTDSWREMLPQITFRHGQEPLVNLFRGRKRRSSTGDRRWYETIYFSYNSQLIRSRSKYRSTKESQFQQSDFLGANHKISVSAPFKLFRYFTFNQSVNYSEDWQDRARDYYLVDSTNQIVYVEKRRFAARRTFRTSLSMNTKIYGIFPVNRRGIIGFRHVMTPNISFSYQPDFSDPRYGYYEEIADTTGRIFKKDRFEGSAFGGTSSYGQKSIFFSLNNLFQMKRMAGGKEKKSDLFTVNLSTGYNFNRDSLKLSNLSTSFRASPSRLFNFTMSMTHSFYQTDASGERTIDKYLFEKNPWSPIRLTHVSLSSQLRLSDELFRLRKKEQKKEGAATDSTLGEFTSHTLSPAGSSDRFGPTDQWAGQRIPWNANLSFSFSESITPIRVTRNAWVNINGSMQLTKNWRIRYNARLDLVKKKVLSQDFQIYRDLHCWEASFTWTPTGPYKRYYLRINIKSSLLKDIKLEKRGGRGSILGYY